jgi:hypothetical protein
MTEKAIARGEKIRHHNENCFHIKVYLFYFKNKLYLKIIFYNFFFFSLQFKNLDPFF